MVLPHLSMPNIDYDGFWQAIKPRIRIFIWRVLAAALQVHWRPWHHLLTSSMSSHISEALMGLLIRQS